MKLRMSIEEGTRIADEIAVGAGEVSGPKGEIHHIAHSVIGLLTQADLEYLCFPPGRPPSGGRVSIDQEFVRYSWELRCAPKEDPRSRQGVTYVLNVACHLKHGDGGSHRAYDFLPDVHCDGVRDSDVHGVRWAMGGLIAMLVTLFPVLSENMLPLREAGLRLRQGQ